MASSTNGLSEPGSSAYESNTLSVGDGTWDSDRNSFLLPNLQGLNFATMQYNGMGNRFRDLPQYHNLIMGHAVVAAITFLGVVPAAIFIARFYHHSGRKAYKLHVYLQILNVFLATVVLVLGWFAVGPERSLSNPHHGIGVAIYVAILAQFLYGWWMSKRERKRKTAHPTIPLKVHIHRIFGRSVALLAFVQIALGMTLYGSPKVLFILYALFGAFLIFAYLTLEYRNKPRFGSGAPLPGPHSDYPSDYYSDYTGSYLTGSRTDISRDRRRGHGDKSSGWAKKALAGAGAFGAYKWWKGRKEDKEADEKESEYDSRHDRRDDRRQGGPPPGQSEYSQATSVGPQGQYGRPGTPDRRSQSRPPPQGGYNTPHRARHNNESEMSLGSWDDKDDDRPQDNTWRNRIVGGVAGIAAMQGVKSLFGSKKKRKDGYVDSEVSYRPPPHGRGHQSQVSQTDVSRVEAGQAPFSPDDRRDNRRVHMADTQPMTPTRPPQGRRNSGDYPSYSETTSFAPPRRQTTAEGPNLRESIATMGAIAGLRDWSQRRKNRREDERLERVRKQELQHEASFNRRNSDRYPRPQDASGRRESLSDTIMTGPTGQDPTLGDSRQSMRPPDTSHPPLPASAGMLQQGQYQGGEQWQQQPQQQYPQPPQPPYHDPYQQQSYLSQQHQQQQNQQVMFDLPPPPPGPPPNAARPLDYNPPPPGSLQMPQGVMNPDPSRLVSSQQHQNLDQSSSNFPTAGLAAAGGAAAGYAAGQHHQRTQSESPSRRGDSRTRYNNGARRASTASASVSQLNSAGGPGSPPVSVKVNMHPDGRHVTLRRLNEDEAAAERAARKRGDGKKKGRRNSSLSSGVEEGGAGAGRYRRTGGTGHVRNSSQQPIANVPLPPPAMSNSGVRRDSELNLPPVPPGHSSQMLSQGSFGGGMGSVGSPGGGVGSPSGTNAGQGGTDLGTGTDLSNFDNNRRRRRAERARRMEAANAAKGAGGGKGVEFS